MDPEEFLERYEAYGDESLYAEAKPLYEAALANDPGNAFLQNQYGYLLECHGRRSIRAAADCYQRAIDANPGWTKPHFQLISALTALGEADTAVSRYKQWVADASGDVRGYHLLSVACLSARDYEQAAQVIRAGLEVAPDDPGLAEQQGDLYAATGRPEQALTSWQRASALAADDYGISMHYSAAFLLEELGRLAEAAEEWRFIIGWCSERGYSITADWPKQELQRVEARLAGG